MTDTDIRALIERVETASEGSRELDATIFDAIVSHPIPEAEPADFTTSLDAAMLLVPATLGGQPIDEWTIGGGGNSGEAHIWNSEASVDGYAHTPALALIAACLKARLT